ncbi:MAG: hypothetical protein ACO3A2_02085 [Bdellovibrionia bacterium]
MNSPGGDTNIRAQKEVWILKSLLWFGSWFMVVDGLWVWAKSETALPSLQTQSLEKDSFSHQGALTEINEDLRFLPGVQQRVQESTLPATSCSVGMSPRPRTKSTHSGAFECLLEDLIAFSQNSDPHSKPLHGLDAFQSALAKQTLSEDQKNGSDTSFNS